MQTTNYGRLRSLAWGAQMSLPFWGFRAETTINIYVNARLVDRKYSVMDPTGYLFHGTLARPTKRQAAGWYTPRRKSRPVALFQYDIVRVEYISTWVDARGSHTLRMWMQRRLV